MTQHDDGKPTNTRPHPWNDVPLFAILTKPLAGLIAPIWNLVCSFRWALSRPLKTSVLPKWCPGFVRVPALKHAAHVTYGEVRPSQFYFRC